MAAVLAPALIRRERWAAPLLDAYHQQLMLSHGRIDTIMSLPEPPELTRLRGLLADDGVTTTTVDDNGLSVVGLDSAQIGRIAADQSIALTELSNHRSTLEQIFMDLTAGAVDYSAHRLNEPVLEVAG